MAWGKEWGDSSSEVSEEDQAIITEAKECAKDGEEWEGEARVRFDYDYKFANGDTHNKYQWDSDLILRRETENKPILTINKVQQHNLLIINDSKQNKPGIRIRPVSDEASFEAAELFQELVYHIEYISSAENVYDSGMTWQVEAGIGYWTVDTDWIDDNSFEQEIYIRNVRDPRAVYLDPNINTQDGSDARWGIIFEDIDKDLFAKKYPKFEDIGSAAISGGDYSGWITKDHIKVAIFYRREEKEDRLIAFVDNEGNQQIGRYSALSNEGKQYYNSVKNQPTSRERKIVTQNIKKYKIAGNQIIEKTDWLGKYIPIVRLPGIETVIDGVLDRKGHTRAMINAQQMYNYHTSSNTEFISAQTKTPWVASMASIEGYLEYYENANIKNYSYMPYNAYDDEGNALPAPQRNKGVEAGMGYIEGLKIAQNEMMMASGQWQAQLGENENAKSGVAINARQRQGDRATYHFTDNQAIAIRYTGKIIIDLIPKVYDTERIKKITARNGRKINVKIDPNAKDAYQKMDTLNPDQDVNKQIQQVIFNPSVGIYDIQSDTGPSFATKRQEAFNALTQIAATNKEFWNIAGDLYFKVADFNESDELAERFRRIIPPNVIGEGPDPKTEELMHQASDHIQQLSGQLQVLTQKLTDKDRELAIREGELELRQKEVAVEQQRLDYDAETKRLTALGNSGPGLSIEQIQPIIKQLISGMAQNGELLMNAPGPHEGGTPIMLPSGDNVGAPNQGDQGEGGGEEQPPIEGARKAGDGQWYLQHPTTGGYMQVMPQDA